MNTIEKVDIQGLVFSGYGNMPYASYHPLKIGEDQVASAKQWIKILVEANKITHGAERKQDWCLNIAFSQQGLEKLGISPEDMNNSFDNAFVDGMDSDRRQKLLHDDEESVPGKWLWGNKEIPVDLMLMIFGSDEATMNSLIQEEQLLYQRHGLSLSNNNPLTPAVFGDVKKGEFRKEHFGFSDGISQPIVEGFPATAKVKENLDDGQRIAAGEFVLGYQNEYDRLTKIPKITSASENIDDNENFGKNGTYMVFRQLKQNVPAFWKYFKEQTENGDELEQQLLAAKCMGRWPSGVLVDEKQTQDPATEIDNTYDFSDDVHGQGCPIGSHVRRANPRAIGLGETTEQSQKVVNLHRIIRRARSYGKPIEDRYQEDEQERGLFFICINANIERQFEFVQHTWINNVKFNNLYDEKDPVIGAAVESSDNPMTIPKSPVRKRLHDLKRFVTTRGGGYFFLPGLTALRTLAGI